MVKARKLNSWLEMVHILCNNQDVVTKDLVDGETFIIDHNWVGFIMRLQLFKGDNYTFYVRV